MRVFGFVIAFLIAAIVPAQAAESFRDCPDCPVMVNVPAGSFMMGSSESDLDWAVGLGAKRENILDETPQHFVSVPQFAMSATEVTRDQFAAFVQATGYEVDDACWTWDVAARKAVKSGSWRDPRFRQSGNHPVVCVNWNDAKAYVSWLSQKTGKSYRLPSEAEWEYAARAGTTTGRPWGWGDAEACVHGNVADTAARNIGGTGWLYFPCTDGYPYTAPVGQFRANAFGLSDMMGNAWEWTEDCYSTSYAGAPTDGSASFAGDCSLRVLRGGSWD